MTMSEFDTLRADLAAIRSDLETRIGGLREDVDRLHTDMHGRLTGLRTDMDLRFTRIEAKIDEKLGAGVIHQAPLAMMTGMFAIMIGTVILLKTLAYIP